MIARLRHIPRPGEFITEAGYRFIVAEANERAIIKLRVESANVDTVSPQA